jgi:hypothetical protein
LISSKVEDILQKYKRAHFSNIINIHCTLTASNLLRRSRALQQQSCHQSRWLLHPRLGRPSTCDCNRLHMFKKHRWDRWVIKNDKSTVRQLDIAELVTRMAHRDT